MNETEAILIIIAIVVGILILVGGLGWGISAYARDQRRTRSGRTEEYHPPPPLPPPTERPVVPEPDEHPGIRWGDVAESSVAEPGIERVRFGNPEQMGEYEYVSVNPYTFDPILKCPTCKVEIDESQNNTMICPDCDTYYHDYCWEDNNNSCPGCGYKED